MKKNNIVWVDIIRIVAILLVIVLHAATPLVYSFNKIPNNDWWIANIYHSISNVCVPLFFMISGYLLLDKDEPVKTFLHKRISKVLIPLAIWTLVYLLWNKYYNNIELNLMFSLIKSIIEPAHYHLWFLYTILGLYLFIPILNIFIRHSSEKIKYYS